MTKNSMATLSEKVQQQLLADQQAVSSQTSKLLEQHASALSELSRRALGTTETAMAAQTRTVTAAIDRTTKQVQDRLRWMWRMTLVPLFGALLLSSVLMVGAALWAWWKVDQATSHVQQLEAQFCATPAGRTFCQPVTR